MHAAPSRRTNLTGMLLLCMAALFMACGRAPSYGRILDEGDGPANEQPLWPLATGTMMPISLPWGEEGLRPQWHRPVVVSQRDTDEGRLVTIDLAAANGTHLQEFWWWWLFRETIDLLETRSGDVVVVEPDGRRYLLVPATVRVGMRWHVDLSEPKGAYNFDSCHLKDSGGTRRIGSGGWTFQVTARDLVEGPFGKATVWTVSVQGPPLPHVSRNGKADDGICGGFAVSAVPTSRIPRRSHLWRFIEGVGPDAFLGLDVDWMLRSGIGPLSPAVMASMPIPVDTAETLAGSRTPDLAAIPVERVATLEPDRYAWEGFHGLWFGRTARLTWSSTERSQGYAAELMLSGSTIAFSTQMNPVGGIQGDWWQVSQPLCFAIDPDTGRLLPLDRLASECPDRQPENPLLERAYDAQPYVRSDGYWWTRLDVERLYARSFDFVDGSYTFQGVHTQGPFLYRGLMHVLNCHGDRAEDPCELIGFPNDAPTAWLWKTSRSGMIQGLYIWGLEGSEPVRPGERDENSGNPPPRHTLRFAITHPEGLIHVATAVWPSSRIVSSWSPGPSPDGAHRNLVVRWFTWDGRLLDFRSLPTWQPGLTHWDGRYRLTDVRPLGELYEYEIGPGGIRTLVHGRLDLPSDERAEFALALPQDRFLVVASRPRGDGDRIGILLDRTFDWQESRQRFGVVPAVPDSHLRDLHFYVTSPVRSEPLVDPVPLVHGLWVWVTGDILSLCDLPDGDPPLWIDSVVLPTGPVPLRDRPRDARGCHHVLLSHDLVRAARRHRTLPITLEVRNLGLFRRVLEVPDPEEPAVDVIPPLPSREDRLPKSVRPVASNLYCGPSLSGDARNPGELIPYSLTGCAFYPWDYASSPFPTGEVDHCDPTRETCLDLLAYDGDPAILNSHDWWVASEDNPWAPGRKDLFPPGRIYWIPKDRPPGPLVAADFERAVPLDSLRRHWRVVPDPGAWRLPDSPAGTPGIDGVWPEESGVPVVEDRPFDPASLLSGTGLERLPDPDQVFEAPALRLSIYRTPIGKWVLETVEPTTHGLSRRYRSGSVPRPSSVARATDGTVILWDTGEMTRLDGGDCLPQPETCNGLDDDCDGSVDETDFEGCPDPDAVRQCREGVCFRSGCVPGWASCSRNPWRCDVPLGTERDCLACDDRCPEVGGSVCRPDGCTAVQVLRAIGAGGYRYVLYGDGSVHGGPSPDDRDTDPVVFPARDIVAGSAHFCVLDPQGRVRCRCFGSRGQDCQGVEAPFAENREPWPIPEADRIWAGLANTCVRLAADGRVVCKGAVTADGAFLGERAEIPALAGAESIAFSRALAGMEGFAVVGGRAFRFGHGASGLQVEPLTDLPPVLDLVGAENFVLFRTSEGWYALGGLGRFPALGGPQGSWNGPVRVPGLDDAIQIVTGVSQAPCKTRPGAILCPLELGSPPFDPRFFVFDAPPIVRNDGWLEIPASFQQAYGIPPSLCIVKTDLAATLDCRP